MDGGETELILGVLLLLGILGFITHFTEQHTATQPRMEAANVTTEAIAKSERSTYRKVEIVFITSHVSVPIQ